ncbi:Esterase-like activity of phytase [Halopseudomonas xinjiangensis]|uniref:Esterase-like activity of phytase n=1 Tax=Halopseudomonas xinjiangensis TaxID=487184 RepID=A0A1H1M4S7_9GAMM|nr:esterase-like activity of phytase family protein [Halopseudomonas xinjiangensis]SDR81019.1 Esterase-like activity of phytase [Halopseudomonas xinjiangensis]
MSRACCAWLLASLLAILCSPLGAFERAPELTLEKALPVAGMSRGNLSGMTRCDGRWLAVSDRVDADIFVLHEEAGRWQAEPESFVLPQGRPSTLPLHLQAGAWIRSLSGQAMDFEAIACDDRGNRYLLSESLLGVLQLPPHGDVDSATQATGKWIDLGEAFYQQGVDAGLWQQTNATAEGLAVSGDGESIWFAAERLSRGLVRLQWHDDLWRCPVAGCVLLAERRYMPAQPFGSGVLAQQILSLDFSDLYYWRDRLWTLERNEHQVCRRHPVSGQRERCWSFAETLLSHPYLYPDAPFGVAETLYIDEMGVTIGLDNNGRARLDDDTAPWVFSFALPDDWETGYNHE